MKIALHYYIRLPVVFNTTAFAPVYLPVADRDTDVTAINKFVGIYEYRGFDEVSSSVDSSGSDKNYTKNERDSNLEFYV